MYRYILLATAICVKCIKLARQNASVVSAHNIIIINYYYYYTFYSIVIYSPHIQQF